jgi:hypothetical protein
MMSLSPWNSLPNDTNTISQMAEITDTQHLTKANKLDLMLWSEEQETRGFVPSQENTEF